MSSIPQKSRVGFAVIKLRVGGCPYFLMRANPKWKDINFIGGHEKERDYGDLEKTTRRELWEEVPSIRVYSDFRLQPLTEKIDYGPIFSKSRGRRVSYEVQFFLLHVEHSPAQLVNLLSARTRNVWVPEDDLKRQRRFRISGLVKLLDDTFPGGLQAIPYSSQSDLHEMRERFEPRSDTQLEFALK